MAANSSEYLDPYREAVEQFGPGFPATLWMSREAQQLRFDVMIEMTDLTDRVILDAGCATGDLAEYLIERGVEFKRYVGIDAVPELIEAAKQRDLATAATEFHLADLIHNPSSLQQHEPDWVCISGTLNTMEEATARRLVSAAFDAAKQGLVFNFLSDRAPPHYLNRDIGPSRRFNTLSWLDWAMSRTSLVSFSQEYLEGHDATIVMRKAQANSAF